jgi:hypothetical protein
MSTLALPAYAQLSDADEAALTDLYRRGPPPNTLRAWERDLADITAWKMASFGRPLDWPEDEKVALRFIPNHAQDLTKKPGTAQDVAMELIAIGLRRALACPAPATLDRRIASWQAFHRKRNLPSLLRHALCLFRSAQEVLSRRSGWNWPASAIRPLI